MKMQNSMPQQYLAESKTDDDDESNPYIAIDMVTRVEQKKSTV